MRFGRLLFLSASLGIAGTGGAGRADPAPIEQGALTPHYRIVLQIGPAEVMYTATEARTRHPASGEIMVGGRMTDGMSGIEHGHAGMSIPDRRHVELHVFSRATGKVVAEAHVTIRITGPDSKTLSVPIARMYGIDAGPDDLHHGNNVKLPPGSYIVRAAVNGERARFPVSLQ